MSEKPKLTVTIISQHRQLEPFEVESLTLPTTEGEITVLPGHVPLLTKLQAGVLRYKLGNTEDEYVVAKGFADIGPDNTINILVDSATVAREISLERAEIAMKAAQETMSKTTDQRELLMAEASLKLALLEIKVAQKTKRARI